MSATLLVRMTLRDKTRKRIIDFISYWALFFVTICSVNDISFDDQIKKFEISESFFPDGRNQLKSIDVTMMKRIDKVFRIENDSLYLKSKNENKLKISIDIFKIKLERTEC
jgi:hypothetical protein